MSAAILALTTAVVSEVDDSYGWGFVVAGWSIVVVALVAYVIAMTLKGRALAKQVPPEHRRWM